MIDRAAYSAIDGLTYWGTQVSGFRAPGRSGPRVIRAGTYPNGSGALQVENESGELEFKITANLPGVALAPDEFCVKWATDGGALADYDLHVLERLGLFADTRRRIDAGYVTSYAAVWRFRRCDALDVVLPFGRHDGHGDYAVCCIDCRLAIRAKLEEQLTLRAGREGVRRLATLAREDEG